LHSEVTLRGVRSIVFRGALTAAALAACASREGMRPPEEPVLSTHASAPTPETPPPQPNVAPSESRVDEVGMASWYGGSLVGRKTANGERYDPRLFTAAHKKLPFGTWVEVRRVDTGRTVRVRINDRGPNGRAASRIIDLSRRAAEEIDLVRAGVARVELRVVHGP
jgi:rare lipoprotein A